MQAYAQYDHPWVNFPNGCIYKKIKHEQRSGKDYCYLVNFFNPTEEQINSTQQTQLKMVQEVK